MKGRIMKSLLVTTLLLLVALSPGAVSAQQRGFGIGVVVGEPTGISLKHWLSAKTAVDAAVAWSFARESSFHLHADYLMHAFDEFDTEESVPLYYGIGGRLKTSDGGDARLGVRGVIGIGYLFREAPIDLFFELAPVLDVAPRTELSINGGFGARYFFR
jgi:hypothetical protein